MIARALIGVIFAVATSAAQAETPSNGVVSIQTDTATHVFQVEIADEPGERNRGLMFRDSLDEDAGMLFIYPEPGHASFWMKNTKIPLDMLFIDEDGTIVRIAPETTPFSLDAVRSGEPVIAVLEIDGGDAEQLDIEAGDTVTWKIVPASK